MGFLFPETDLLLEVGIWDDVIQSGSSSNISKFGIFPASDREDFNSSDESTISTSLIQSIASDGKSEELVTWFLNLIFQHKNVESLGNLSNWRSDLCCLCCPTIEFCGLSTGNNESMVLANVGIGLVALVRSSSLAAGVPVPICTGTDPVAPGVAEWWIRWWWFRDESNVEDWLTKKRFPVIPMYSMCQEAGVCRGSAWNENLESLLADWKGKTISHCNLIPLLEIFLNHSQKSSALAFPAFVKWAFVLLHDFLSIFVQRIRPLHFSHQVHTLDLRSSENLFLHR